MSCCIGWQIDGLNWAALGWSCFNELWSLRNKDHFCLVLSAFGAAWAKSFTEAVSESTSPRQRKGRWWVARSCVYGVITERCSLLPEALPISCRCIADILPINCRLWHDVRDLKPAAIHPPPSPLVGFWPCAQTGRALRPPLGL